MVTYDQIQETFAKEGCTLLTTREEMEEGEMHSRSKYRIIATCGHEVQNCWYHMFKYRGTGKICKACTDAKHAVTSKEMHRNLVDCNSYTLSLEYQSIELIKKYAGDLIRVSVSPECCLADIAVKDMACNENKWLPLQVKATFKGRHNIYSFGISRNYPDMWIILICIEEEKFWIMNGNDVLNQCKISIGMQKSKKYDKCAVDKHKLSEKFDELYKKTETLQSLDVIHEPITDAYKKEQMFRRLREATLNTVPFETPLMNQSVYDFKVNGFKVQEKTATLQRNKSSPMVCIGKNNHGKVEAYHVNDNDYYWINLPDKTHFYVFPKDVLSEHNMLSTDNSKGNKNLFLGKKQAWIDDHKYSYNEENINAIVGNLFKLTI